MNSGTPTSPLKLVLAFLPGIVIGALYGLISRFLFGASPDSTVWLTMTFTFLLVVPLALGYLTVWLAPPHLQIKQSYALFAPWLACLLLFITVFLFKLEIVLCLLMASPLFLALASGGGFFASRLVKNRRLNDTAKTTFTALIIFLPYLVAPLESTLPTPSTIRTVATEIVINAPADIVWKNLIAVPTITEQEQRTIWPHQLGVPRPIAAVLSHEGVGGVRFANYDNGLLFRETVTVWEPNQRFAFAVQPAVGNAPAPWNMIGGKYLDILDAEYRLEPLADGSIRLHLVSHHRLSTRFNPYGALWSDTILRNLQNYILRILKERAEAERSAAGTDVSPHEMFVARQPV